MSKSLYRLPIIAAALVIAGSAVISASPKNDWDEKAKKRKAEYIFLESQSAYSAEDYDKYITLVERAYSLDSNDVDIAGEWAFVQMMNDNSDSAKMEKSYQLLTRRFKANPANFYASATLANVAQQQHRFEDALSIWETLDSIYPKRPEVAQELAKSYLYTYMFGDSANFDKAMAIYNRIEEGTGRTLGLTSAKIQAYYLKNDTLAVVNELDSLYAYAPNDSYTAQFIGANFEYLDKPDMAIKFYDLACELDSTNGAAYLQRAKFYHQQGDSVAFDREVFLALKSANLEVDSKMEILRSYVSELYEDTTQDTRIRQLFNELQLMHAGEPEIHSMYGGYLFGRKDYTGAAEQFSYEAALTPNSEAAWTLYIQSLALAEDTTTLVNVAYEAIEKFPENLYMPIILSNVYRINNNNEKALEVLNSVDVSQISNERAVSNFLTSKGDLYAVLGDTIKSLEVYDEAIELNPDNSMALNNAAYFMTISGGDLAKAEKYSARSLQNDELNPTYLDTYAWVFFNKKDYSMAKHYIDIALNSYAIETDSTAVGDVSANADEEELAETIVEVVEAEEESLEQPSAEIFDHAGDIYFMNGEIEKALDFWKKAHELDPADALIEKKVNNKTIFFR